MGGTYIKKSGFTIIELLTVIVVIGILTAITIVAFNGVQSKAWDSARITKVKSISKALELYYVDNGMYPPIQDGGGYESTCGSQTDNWGHCDRTKILADSLATYIQIDPTSLSNATQGNYYYYYTSQASDGYQSYGLMVYLETNAGQNDGGYYANAYETGNKPSYCLSKYSGTNGDWMAYNAKCVGGN